MKNNILIMFFVIGYFLIISPYQIFKNGAILIISDEVLGKAQCSQKVDVNGPHH